MAAISVQFSVATHLMAALGFYYGTEQSSALLATSVNADHSFVRKSLSKLAKAGLVISTRGKNGATMLARAPSKITLLDIYLASEAPSTFAVHSYPPKASCPVSSHFKETMGGVLARAQEDFERHLRRTTLAEVVADIRKKAR